MEGEFYFLIVAQLVLMLVLAAAFRIRIGSKAALFSPIAWLLLFYSLTFFIPQVFLPAFDYTLIGAYNIIKNGQIERVIETQRVLTTFLLAVTAAAIISGRSPGKPVVFEPLNGRDQFFGVVALLVGIAGVTAILASFDPGNSRSIIVASSIGKLLYAISFWFTLGYMILAAWLIRRRHWLLLAGLTVLFAAALLPLGGRGRILWPIAGLVAWASITGHVQAKIWKLGAAALVLGVTLQALDPLLLYWRGYDSADAAVERFQQGLALETFLFGRNFDAFHNVAVIVNENRIAPSFRYLIDGAQAPFMSAYFPSVAWNGVGYPATLPGGLWISGRLPIVFLGGIGFGLFLGLLTRAYRRMRSELAVIVYCIAMPWLTHVGISYLDSYVKMAALILPGLVLIAVRRRRRIYSSPQQLATAR